MSREDNPIAGSHVAYSGTIAADGKTIKSLHYDWVMPLGTTAVEFANIPYIQEAGRSVETSGWRVLFADGDATKLFVSGFIKIYDGSTEVLVLSGDEKSNRFELAFGNSPDQAKCTSLVM